MKLEDLPDHLFAAKAPDHASGATPVFVVQCATTESEAVREALELVRANAKHERTIEIRNWLLEEANRIRPHAPQTASIFDEIRTMLELATTPPSSRARAFDLAV